VRIPKADDHHERHNRHSRDFQQLALRSPHPLLLPWDDPFETLLDSALFESFFNSRWLGSQAQVLALVK
jgi:hypothetical protein